MSGDRLEKLEQRLYSRRAKERQFPATDLTQAETETTVDDSWHEDQTSRQSAGVNRVSGLLTKFWHLALVLGALLVLLAVAAWYYAGINKVTTDKVVLVLDAPTTVHSTEGSTLKAKLINYNKVALDKVVFHLDYPGAVKYSPQSVPAGRVGSNKAVEASLPFTLVGEEGSAQTVRVVAEYSSVDSDAVFTVDKDVNILLASAPVSLRVKPSVTSVQSGNELEFTLEVESNSLETLENLEVKADFPFGFTITTASPDQSAEGVWKIAKLEPSEIQTIKLAGRLEGENNEKRTFRFAVKDLNAGDKLLATGDKLIEIVSEPLSLVLQVNNATRGVVLDSGRDQHVNLLWQNNTGESLDNLELHAYLTGDGFIPDSIKTRTGFYNSAENFIVWNFSTNPKLAHIKAGESGSVVFDFKTVDDFSQVRDFAIGLKAEAEASEPIGYERKRIVKDKAEINLKLNLPMGLIAKATNTDGEVRANRTSTYRVTWQIPANQNDIRGAKVAATLPVYAKWSDKNEEKDGLSYTDFDRTILWRAGDMSAGTTKTVSFWVDITPSTRQVEDEILVTNPALLSGFNTLTGRNISIRANNILTGEVRR